VSLDVRGIIAVPRKKKAARFALPEGKKEARLLLYLPATYDWPGDKAAEL